MNSIFSVVGASSGWVCQLSRELKKGSCGEGHVPNDFFSTIENSPEVGGAIELGILSLGVWMSRRCGG